jgi:hypothetical protein
MTKHEIPASGYGVALPWKLVTGLSNATEGGANDPAGTRVYLDGGAEKGSWSKTAGGTTNRAVGIVVAQGSGPTSTDGAILFCGEGNS